MKSYQGSLVLEAPPQVTWQFVTDPEKIGACMPDVVGYSVLDSEHLMAKVRVGVGPIRAVFEMAIALVGNVAEGRARMEVQGTGMGNGIQMTSEMSIEPKSESADQTLLQWSADVAVSGPLATLGGRVLENQVKKTTEKVFENIRQGIASSLAR